MHSLAAITHAAAHPQQARLCTNLVARSRKRSRACVRPPMCSPMICIMCGGQSSSGSRKRERATARFVCVNERLHLNLLQGPRLGHGQCKQPAPPCRTPCKAAAPKRPQHPTLSTSCSSRSQGSRAVCEASTSAATCQGGKRGCSNRRQAGGQTSPEIRPAASGHARAPPLYCSCNNCRGSPPAGASPPARPPPCPQTAACWLRTGPQSAAAAAPPGPPADDTPCGWTSEVSVWMSL